MGSGEDRQFPPFTTAAGATQLEDFFAWQAGAQLGYAGFKFGGGYIDGDDFGARRNTVAGGGGGVWGGGGGVGVERIVWGGCGVGGWVGVEVDKGVWGGGGCGGWMVLGGVGGEVGEVGVVEAAAQGGEQQGEAQWGGGG